MAYKIIFKQPAQREFENLTHGQKKAIAREIDKLKDDPHPPGAINLEGYPAFWRITARNIRAIYLEPLPDRTIFILRVAERKSAYEDLSSLMQLVPPD